jgi:hypothetical protein
MATDAVSLGSLKSIALNVMGSSEASLFSKLASISNGDTVTNLDLLSYQMELAANSLTASVCSSIAKERADTLKGVVQKF